MDNEDLTERDVISVDDEVFKDKDDDDYLTRDASGVAVNQLGRLTTNGGGRVLKAPAQIASAPFQNVGSRKLLIKNFQKKNGFGQNDFEEQWTVLADAVQKIQSVQRVQTSGERLYDMVLNLCQKNFGGEIYMRLKNIVETHAARAHSALVDECQSKSVLEFMNALNCLWEIFCQQMLIIRSVFLYLDRAHREQNVLYVGIWDLGLDAFRSGVICKPTVYPRLISGLLELIENERNGLQVDRSLLRSLLRMLINLRVYEQKFEPDFFVASERFYEREGQSAADELEIGAYLRLVRRRLDDERERVQFYMEYGTGRKLIAIMDRCLIAQFAVRIITRGLDLLLADDRQSDVALMYELLGRTKDGLSDLKTEFTQQVKKIGKALVMDADRDQTLIDELMMLKRQLDSTIRNCFHDNEKFQHALQDAFAYFVNTRPNKLAELIAKYMDRKLRVGNKECSEEELDRLMDQAVALFRSVHGKDVFEAFYKRDLAKRLLLGRSASVDAEKAMIAKLTAECGSGLTQKMEGMFKDMELSREFNITFKKYMESGSATIQGGPPQSEFNVAILTMGNWPAYTLHPNIAIPPELIDLQTVYARFYTAKYSSRRLQWQYSLTSAILRASFRPGVIKELNVSLFQAMVLLLFNDNLNWSYSDIADRIRIEKPELDRTLQSLACGKWRVLVKTPKGREICEKDEFVLNENFDDRLFRIHISQVQMRETAEEHRQTEQEILQDRQYQIDAAVVRIMKTRKKLSHSVLINELFVQLRFPTKSSDLKKRIESLIEREYMARDKQDQQLYHYVT